MGVEDHYKQKLDQLQGPRMTRDFIPLARALFDAARGDTQSGFVVPQPTGFRDNVEATQVWWEVGNQDEDHELFQVQLIGRSLSFALQHRHAQDADGLHNTGSAFIDQRKTVLVVGSQNPTISSHDGMRDQGTRNAIRGRETDVPMFRDRGRNIILPAFRRRLDHTMAVVGIHESVPDIHESIPELQELLRAS